MLLGVASGDRPSEYEHFPAALLHDLPPGRGNDLCPAGVDEVVEPGISVALYPIDVLPAATDNDDGQTPLGWLRQHIQVALELPEPTNRALPPTGNLFSLASRMAWIASWKRSPRASKSCWRLNNTLDLGCSPRRGGHQR